MKNIFVKFKSPLTIILLLVLFGGAYTYQRMQTSLFPNVTFPKIKIIAENGEQPVDKMMVTVTKPLEDAIKKVENLDHIRSITSMGSCEISAFMDWGSNIDLAKQRIESQINQIKNNLPPDVQITVEKMNPSILPVMGYSLQSDSLSPIELKQIATYIVKPYLSRISGVSEVDIIGGKEKEYRIVMNQQKLILLEINVLDVYNALLQTDFIKSNGYTIDYNRLYLSVTDATIKNIKQLENLTIFNDGKRILKLSDIAKVEVNERSEYVKIKADGRDVPLIAILKQPAANLIQVSDSVLNKIAELNKILPKGVTLKPYYNQAEFVNDSVRSIIDVLWVGLLLAMVVVIIFLRSIKSSAVILITIPLTLSLTLIVMRAAGFDFNIMTIGAIAAAIGLIIDDAIIVLEQIHRFHELNPEQKPSELVGKAVQFLIPAMVSSSLSTIVILIPFELMSGVAGAYFKIMTETMIITLLSSFVITWLGLPVLYLLFSKDRPIKNHTEKISVKPKNWILFLTNRPYISVLFIVFLITSIIIVFPKLKTGFLPEMDEGSIVLDYNSPQGTSLEETDRLLDEVDKIIESIPEVKSYSRRTGTQMGFFITEPNRGDYLIELTKKRTRTTEKVIDEIRKKIESTLPSLTVDFGQVIGDMLGDLINSTQPIEIKIFGDNNIKCEALATQVADSISKINGVADVFNGVVIAGPMIKITPKNDKIYLFGLNNVDFQTQIQSHLEGLVVGSIPEKEQMTDIRLIFPINNKTSFNDMKQIKISDTVGNYYPLTYFADLTIQSGVPEIERENLQTMGVITARLNNRDLGSVMKDIKKMIAKIHIPQSYQVIYGGSYADQQKSFSELLSILLFGSLLVFIIVLFMFRNLLFSISVLVLSFVGIAGSILALFITQTPLNVGSYTGLIMIIGIIGENSIFTIHKFLDEIKTRNIDDAINATISARLRPNLMTVIGAIVALAPLAAGIGTGAQMHQPLAIAVIGGFIVTLPLLVVVLPTMLKIVYKVRKV